MKVISQTLFQRCQRHIYVGSTILFLAMGSPIARGESQDDLLFFLSLDSFENIEDSVPGIDDSYLRPSVDVLYAHNNGRFRLLGEYLWSSTEAELERLKIGWQATDQTMLWFGRFHNTAKYWTTEFHHGQFMQTSISRPGMEAWEDESGPLLSHVTGFSIEHEVIQANQSAISFNVSAGLGSVFSGQQLVPFDLFDSAAGYNWTFNGRIAFRPDALSENAVGIVAGWNDIPVISDSQPELADLIQIDQVTIGFFVDWSWDAWRVISALTHFDNDIVSTGSVTQDKFALGYLQGEYQATQNWTVFGRVETGSGEDDSAFLSLLPAFIAHRHMLGLRWDYADNQSLTTEIADTSTKARDADHYSFKEIRFQWSAVFP